MKRSTIFLLAVIALSAGGAYVSGTLLARHFSRSEGDGWFSAGCKIAGGGCDAVLDSRWAYFPPRPAEEEAPRVEANDSPAAASQPDSQPSTQPSSAPASAPAQTRPASPAPKRAVRVPVAYVGLVYFSALALWFLCVGRANPAGRIWYVLPLLAAALGICGSVYFLIVMFTQLDDKCFWCIVSHAANFAVFPLVVALYPRRPRAATSADPLLADGALPASTISTEGAALMTPEAGLPYPSPRLALVTLLAIAAVGVGEFYMGSLFAAAKQNAEYQRVLADYMRDGESLYAAYLRGPKHDIKPTPGEHFHGGGKLSLQTIVFADFECPHCREVSRMIDEQFQPMFKGNLHVVFKHYPLNSDCNPHAQSKVHAHACEAARAAEAAYLQGGNPKFWEAHDKLFAVQRVLGRIDYRAFAVSLKLDPEKFVQDMQSETAAQRIAQDVELASSLNLKGTPRIFVNGREVPDLAMRQQPFWKTMSVEYWRLVQKEAAKAAASPSPHGH